MVRISRVVIPGYPHHITQRGVRSMTIFHSDTDRQSYLQFLSEELGRFCVEVLAWCLMTNLHLIAVPKSEDSLARAVGEAHRRYTRMKNFAEGVWGYLFQRRFSSCVLDERHLLATTQYIELNPVRVGMVEEAWVYPWSSASFHLGQREGNPLIRDRKLMDLVNNWEEFLSKSSSEMDESIRGLTRAGRPAGDTVF